MNEILKCPHCGCEEFMAPAAAHDFVRIVDGAPEIIRSEAHDGGDFSELACAKCGEDAPDFDDDRNPKE